MTDKEFKRLSRSQLIEIIYQFQIKEEELTKENHALKAALEDRRIRINQAGSIAEAALQVNDVMQSAQKAAQQYLDEIRTLYSEVDKECQTIRTNATAEADAIIEQARVEADAIVAQARRDAGDLVDWAALKQQEEAELEEIISEFGDSLWM